MTRISQFLPWQSLYPFLVLAALAFLANGLFFVPALYADDWTNGIEMLVNGSAQWVDVSNRRPLLSAPFLLQYRLFALNVSGQYLVIWFLYVVMAFLVYQIVSRFPLLRQHSFSLVVALLFLVYPTNYTHMWLTMLHIYLGFVLTLLYGYLLLRFAENGRWSILALALACLLISFGLYEGAIGLAAVWPLVLLFRFRQTRLSVRVSLITPLLLSGGFAVWRAFGQQTLGVEDHYVSQIATTPALLLSRLILGYRISLKWGWSYPIQQFLPWIPGTIAAFLFLVALALILVWLVRWAMEKGHIGESKGDISPWSFPQRVTNARPFSFLALLGLGLVGVGYFPIILVFLPTLNSFESRFNLFATVGGTLFFAATAMIFSLLMARNQRQARHLFLAATLPFITLGTATQAAVQYQTRVAWLEQKAIWQSLLAVAPDFVDDTLVLFILPGYQDRVGYQNWHRTPLYASWDATSAVRLFYDNPTLSADVFFPDINTEMEPVLMSDGLFTKDTAVLTSYAKIAAFVYESDTKTLTQIDELPNGLVRNIEFPVTFCSSCVLHEYIMHNSVRRLVQE